MLSVLVVGGYGFFGTRIAQALVNDRRLRVLVGGRSRAKAEAAARALGLPAEQGVAIDAGSGDLAGQLATLRVDLVVHTAGPFQGQDYGVARAAIAAGCHYVDLADSRAFVAGVGALDAEARRRGVSVISGASSVPALSGAVIDRYAARFRRLVAIHIGITSGARVPGPATVHSIFGYVGRPFARLERGAWSITHGWMDLRRHRFPAPVGSRWLGSCDVPDLELFPARYRGVETVVFHAGFASGVGHLVVYALAAAVRVGLLRSARAFAAPLNRVARALEPLISHRSGMFVELSGEDPNGQPLSLTWHLLAAQNHGPQVPCGAAIALVRKWAAGAQLPVGAMPCVGLLTVEEYLEPLRHLIIVEVPP